MSLVTVSITGRSGPDLTTIGTHIANTLIEGGAVVERDFGHDDELFDVNYASEAPTLPWGLNVIIEERYLEADDQPNDDAPAQEDDDLVNTQMAIFEALVDYSDEAKLGLLSYAAAEVIAEYAEGEDRDAMIEMFAQSVESDIEFHDDYEDDMAEGEPTIGEVLDALADQMFAQIPEMITRGMSRNDNRDTYRHFVNQKFYLNLPIYAAQAEDTCADCGCAIHD